MDEAITQFQKALEIKPDYAEAHHNLGIAFLPQGRLGEAIAQFQKALEARPDYPDALNNLAWALATAPQASLRDGNKAVELAQRANRLSGGEDVDLLDTLAAAYAEAGRFDDATERRPGAIELARAAGRQTGGPAKRQVEALRGRTSLPSRQQLSGRSKKKSLQKTNAPRHRTDFNFCLHPRIFAPTIPAMIHAAFSHAPIEKFMNHDEANSRLVTR